MKYKTPNIVMEIPANIENITMNEVIEYLNEVIEYYGPPCEFCMHFDVICEKSYRPRQYMMELGPFEKWHIRKFCEDMEFEEDGENETDKINEKVRHAFDCLAQQYC